VRRRIVVLCTALAVLLGAVGLLGCGEPDEDTTTGSLVLTVYTSGTLQGDGRQAAQDGADAVKLALEQAGGTVGPFTINVVSLDDTDPDTGTWGADEVVTNARRAIADRNIMGYIGDSGSGATALTLPLLNEAGVLQIGPTTGYVGLTRPAGRGEPDRFYPSGVRSFGRIAPADDVQAHALVETMREQGVRRLAVLQDGELEALGIAGLVGKRAEDAGIDVVENKPVDADDEDQSGIAQDVVESGADAALYAGTTTKGGAAVLDALHAADPALALFAPDGLAVASLAAAIEAGTARRLLLTSPALPLDDLPPEAARFGVAFERAYDRKPVPEAVFSYESMRAFMDAVKAAGVKGNDRAAIISAYFTLRERDTALGTWSVTPSGDSTIRRYGLWRVRDGRLAFVREARPAS
jgi:branched-chain amino acid transport system substrate-binding protein